MTEYIDKNKLIEDVWKLSTHLLNEWETMGVLSVINRQPLVNVQPIKQGEWVQSEIPSMDECSLCGNHKMRYQDFVKDRYCSYCGALMINGGKLNGR